MPASPGRRGGAPVPVWHGKDGRPGETDSELRVGGTHGKGYNRHRFILTPVLLAEAVQPKLPRKVYVKSTPDQIYFGYRDEATEAEQQQ